MSQTEAFCHIDNDISPDEYLCDFIDDNKCITCQKYYIVKNNKCSMCLQNIMKCIRCHDFYAPQNEIYCRDCSVHVKFADKTLTVAEILELPPGSFKSLKMNEHLEDIFEIFKVSTGFANAILKNHNKFKILLKICEGKSSGYIFCMLDGQNDFPATILPAKYADELLTQCLASHQSNIQYQYIHAICPFVLDPWNMKTNNTVLKCYYTDFGDMVTCPNNLNSLANLWCRSIHHYFTNNTTDEFLSLCEECDVSVMLHSPKKLKCKNCSTYFHFDCMKDKKQCPECDIKWLITKLNSYDYGSVWVIK